MFYQSTVEPGIISRSPTKTSLDIMLDWDIYEKKTRFTSWLPFRIESFVSATKSTPDPHVTRPRWEKKKKVGKYPSKLSHFFFFSPLFGKLWERGEMSYGFDLNVNFIRFPPLQKRLLSPLSTYVCQENGNDRNSFSKNVRSQDNIRRSRVSFPCRFNF